MEGILVGEGARTPLEQCRGTQGTEPIIAQIGPCNKLVSGSLLRGRCHRPYVTGIGFSTPP